MRDESQVYQRQGFGAGLGIQPPVGLLIVDFVNGFADPGTFGGGNIPGAIDRTVGLLATARERGWPVAHSRIVSADDVESQRALAGQCHCGRARACGRRAGGAQERAFGFLRH